MRLESRGAARCETRARPRLRTRPRRPLGFVDAGANFMRAWLLVSIIVHQFRPSCASRRVTRNVANEHRRTTHGLKNTKKIREQSEALDRGASEQRWSDIAKRAELLSPGRQRIALEFEHDGAFFSVCFIKP